MKLTVTGTGYLGATHAACMAALGHDVLGVDTDPATIDRLAGGHAPFREPGLDDLLAQGLAAGRLRFTTDPGEAARHGRVHFITVGTPQRDDGEALDTGAVETAVDVLAENIAAAAPGDDRPHLLIGRSTVPVGTAGRLWSRLRDRYGDLLQLSWCPEFLREGHAVADSLRPDRIVLGVDSPGSDAAGRTWEQFREIYAAALDDGVPLLVTDFPTAELVKVAANAFLATKISFINAVADVCDATGADVTALSGALGLDPRIGAGGLGAGLGYGGGCLPKDVRGFGARAGELGVGRLEELLGTVDAVNRGRRTKVADLAGEILGGDPAGRRVTVLGAAFKAGSDDVRDSPALAVAADLARRHAAVTVSDPVATDSARRAFPGLRQEPVVRAALHGAELVIVATEWPEFTGLDPVEAAALVARPVVVDARNCLPAAAWRAAGWDYRGLGTGSGLKPASTA
jgi:UDPglucose 6-dehydrogenase